MSEIQLSGLALIFLGALPCYLLAVYIEKHKHYSLFSGWDPARISDEEACGKLMCKGVKVFSLVFGAGGLLLFLTEIEGSAFVIALTVVPMLPLFYYIGKARKLYWS